MAKSKISEKDTKEQESNKAPDLGTVSYDLFDGLYHHSKLFVARLDLLSKCAYASGEYERVMDLICYFIEQEQGAVEPFLNRAINEKPFPKIGTDPEIIDKDDPKVEERIGTNFGAIIGNDRLWEYYAQIKIDGHEPADILEAWLKEYNPEFLEDD